MQRVRQFEHRKKCVFDKNFLFSLHGLIVAALSLIQQEIEDKTSVFNQNSMRNKIVQLLYRLSRKQRMREKATCSLNKDYIKSWRKIPYSICVYVCIPMAIRNHFHFIPSRFMYFESCLTRWLIKFYCVEYYTVEKHWDMISNF